MHVALAVFQPYRDLKSGDNQSLKIQVTRSGTEPRTSSSASQELNHSATAAPFRVKTVEAVILWVYCTILLALAWFGTFRASLFIFLNYFLWLRITVEFSTRNAHMVHIVNYLGWSLFFIFLSATPSTSNWTVNTVWWCLGTLPIEQGVDWQ